MQNSTTKTSVCVPFMGFYESVADHVAERNCFYDWPGSADYSDPSELPEDKAEAFWDFLYENYKKYQADVVETYLRNLEASIEDELGLKLSFKLETIDSPREYNFTTDRIFADCELSELLALYEKIDKKVFADVIKKDFTSCDGFSSFYDADAASEEWAHPEQYDHNQWATVLQTAMVQSGSELYDVQCALLYD